MHGITRHVGGRITLVFSRTKIVWMAASWRSQATSLRAQSNPELKHPQLLASIGTSTCCPIPPWVWVYFFPVSFTCRVACSQCALFAAAPLLSSFLVAPSAPARSPHPLHGLLAIWCGLFAAYPVGRAGCWPCQLPATECESNMVVWQGQLVLLGAREGRWRPAAAAVRFCQP